MEGQSGHRRVLRLDDPLGHLVPPGQVLPSDLEKLVVDALRTQSYRSGNGVPTAPSRLTVKMHPADRAWLPAGFAKHLSKIATKHVDQEGLLVLDGIRVQIVTDKGCDLGSPSVSTGFGPVELNLARDRSAVITAF